MNAAKGTVGCAVLGAEPQIRRGQVSAVFARSAHLRVDGVFLTLGQPDLVAHPYSVLWPGFTLDLPVGQLMTFNSEGLFIDGRACAVFTDMQVFTPKRDSRPVARSRKIALALSASLARAIAFRSRGGFDEVLKHRVSPQPLDTAGRLSGHFVTVGASLSSDLCRTLVARNAEGFSAAAMGLAGMGVGLTPSGDDFLAGVLAALRYYSQSSGDVVLLQDHLDRVACQAGKLTSPFSAFLLAAAAKGMVAEPLADWLDAVHRGMADLAVEKVPEIAKLGHSSGLDTLSGMLLALQTVIGERSWIN